LWQGAVLAERLRKAVKRLLMNPWLLIRQLVRQQMLCRYPRLRQMQVFPLMHPKLFMQEILA
jgi:hypothetical protein